MEDQLQVMVQGGREGRLTDLLGLETMSLAGATTHMADHLIATTETFTATGFAKVLFHGGMLSIDMASQIVLALKVQLASRVFARERERISVDGHVRLELSTRGECLGACKARVGLCGACVGSS